MFYKSTRNSDVKVSSAQAIAQGISKDGGLFVPSEIPSLTLEEIKELGSLTSFEGKHKIFCLTIIGEIEGHSVLPEQSKSTKYEHVIPQLVAIEESTEIEGLLIIFMILLNYLG